MTTMFIRHQVSDYSAWRKVYDAFGPMQTAGGVLADVVYQAVDDPNDVTVSHDFATREAALAFAASPDLRQAMADAGVQGAPTVWLTQRA